MVGSLDAFAALLDQVAGNEPARLRLARRMKTAGFPAEARAIAEAALRNAPGQPEVRALAHSLLGHYVPRWHYGLVRDAARNAAYDAALRRAIRPGSRVLEIGAGTGLLAMMAARAGAAEVVSCEVNPAIAAAAAEIVALNGYADRVRIIASHSDDLRVEDLGGPADLLVSEIISNDLFSELAVSAIDSVRTRLLAPGAAIIPAAATARIALAEGPPPQLMPACTGFDLSPFDRFHPRTIVLSTDGAKLALRSAAADLFEVDFGDPLAVRAQRATLRLESSGGRVNGVAQWLHLRMDAAGGYENRPAPGTHACWGVVFHAFAEPRETRKGDIVTVTGAHDTATLDLWAENG